MAKQKDLCQLNDAQNKDFDKSCTCVHDVTATINFKNSSNLFFNKFVKNNL